MIMQPEASEDIALWLADEFSQVSLQDIDWFPVLS